MGSRDIRNPYHGIDDLQSDFGDDVPGPSTKRKRNDFMETELPRQEPKKKRNEGRAGFEKEHGIMHRRMAKMMSMNAYERHKEMINLYYLSYPGSTKQLERKVQNEKTDYDVLQEHHKFVWSAEDEQSAENSWEKRMARKYYEKLFKEYAIVDLSRYKTNDIGLRWRTEAEVKDGKGQFKCGARKCPETEGLSSWEVNFRYKEGGTVKNTLVKARLCPKCSSKLNHQTMKRKVEKKKREVRRWEKARRRKNSEDSGGEELEESAERKSDEKKDTHPSNSTLSASTDIWEGPAPAETEKTVDDEIDEFLDDIFL